MKFVFCVLCSFAICVLRSAADDDHTERVLTNSHKTHSPLEFPHQSDQSTPILFGSDPKNSNLPPKIFPTKTRENNNSTGPSILSGTEANITEMKHDKHENKVNLTLEAKTEIITATVDGNITGLQSGKENAAKPTAEQEDMLHTKYKGGHDVDELLKPDKKASEKEEKKPTTPKKDLNKEVLVSPDFDKKGPKMNEIKPKSGESMIESTSKVISLSSSVLSNTHSKHHGIIEPAKTLMTVLFSLAVFVSFGAIGLLIWKRITMRRIRRDILINEDDFDEISENMHTFDRAQIQIT